MLSMPPATATLGVARPDLGGGQHDRLEARAADAVDRGRARRVGQAAGERRLAGRRLADAGLEDLAHQDLVDRRAVGQAGALEAARMATPPSSVAGTSLERAAELADRGAPALTMKTCRRVRARRVMASRSITRPRTVAPANRREPRVQRG